MQETEAQDCKPLTDVTNGMAEDKPEELPLPTPTGSDKASITAPVTQSESSTERLSVPLPVEQAANAALTFIIDPKDHELLTKYFGATLKDELIEFHGKILSKPKAKPATFGSLLSEPITDRPLRGRLHADVRRIFESRIETESIDDGKIKLSAAPPVKPHPEGYVRKANPRQQNSRVQTKGQLGWQELGGQFLHFSLYKENKDTMEVILYLCRSLKVKPKDFAFAGTKDRRAVTVQRVSVWRQHAKALEQLNRGLRQARVGDFKYEKHRLELGELDGNQFTITLRDCHFGEDDTTLDDAARVKLANEVVGEAVDHLQADGFINYFGLQRFGTFGIGTDEVGKKILKEDFEGAVAAILNVSPESLEAAKHPERYSTTRNDRIARDDLERALAIDSFNTTGKSHHALEKLPRKFSAESNIIRHLGFRPTDYAGALLTINRNLRTMYVHAYQSLVWNFIASERWSRYGNKVVKGDLVLVDTPAEKAAGARDEVDENGEVVIHAAADDSAVTHDDLFQRARALSAEEAESGKYTIFDIVLPTPGFDIEYPSNDIGDFYKEFMGSERGGGLDPADMRRKIKDFSLSGSYRKFIAQVGSDLSFEIKTYQDEIEQLVETDLEKLQKSRGQDPNTEHRRQQDLYNNKPNGRRQENDQSPKASKQLGDSALKTPPIQVLSRFRDQPKLSDRDVATKMSAWQNLPAKLAADDKLAAAEWEARTPRNPDEIYQPVYKDTFIETSAENEGHRTGYRSTDIIDADGKVIDADKDESKVDSVPAASGLGAVMKGRKVVTEAPTAFPDAMEVDARARPPPTNTPVVSGEKLDMSFDSLPPIRTMEESSYLIFPAESLVPPPALPTVVAIAEDTKESDVEVIVHESIIDRPVERSSSVTTAELPKHALKADERPVKIAVIITFVLGTSQYATMALRELMRVSEGVSGV